MKRLRDVLALPGFSRFLNLLRRFWPELRREKSLVTLSMAALFGEVALRLLEPWPLKFVIDHVLDPQAKAGSAPVQNPVLWLGLAALAWVTFTGFRSWTAYGSSVGFALVGNRVLTRVRAQLYRHLQLLPLSFHNRSRTGDLVVRVIGDVGLLKDVAVTAFLPLLGRIFIMAGMSAVMFWLNWRLTLLALAVLPLFSLRSIRLSRRIRETSRQQRKREGAMAATAVESMTAIRTVQALSLEGRFDQAFGQANQKSLSEGVRNKRLSLKLERTVDVAVALSSAVVLWYGAVLTLRGLLTPGELIVFLQYLKNALKPAKDFAKYTGRLAKASAAGERVIEVLDLTPSVRDREDAVEAPRLKGRIRFEKVSFSHQAGQEALSEVDMLFEPGRTTALVGPSGAGKTTLAGMILRLHDPQSGRVLVDGVDIREYTLQSLRGQISVVLQESLLFATDIADNISAARGDASAEEIEQASRIANAHRFIEKLPQGYQTVVGERGATLSVGQRQRIALARAALRRAPIIILDEPTSGLDEENTALVMEAMQRLAAQSTVVLITHDLNLAASCDRIIYLEDGRVLQKGTHQELMSSLGPYSRVHQARRLEPPSRRGRRMQAGGGVR